MDRRPLPKDRSVAIATLGHAVIAALLGLAMGRAVLYGPTGGAGLFGSLRDPAAALTLLLSMAALLAAGSGISAFILFNIERAHSHARD